MADLPVEYANLPGIDRDSPDVYETTDLPEEDQETQEDDLECESVEKLSVDVNDAFNKFKDKKLDSSGIDFSDRVSRNRRTGYDITRSEYEIAESGGVKETPQEKFQRLQHEIRELTEEVNQIKDNVKEDSSTEKLSPVVLAKQIEHLQHQLTDLHLDELLGANGSLNLSDPQGALQKRLLSEIDSFQNKPKTEDGKGDKSVGAKADVDCVTYQLYYKPEQAKFSQNAKVADVEQRLERLEALLGNNPQKMSSLTAETNNKSLLGAVALLSSKTKLLDPEQLAQVEGRLAALNHKLTQVAEKKEQVEDQERQTKISELYGIVKKWDAVATTLPHVVDRLSALSELHEQALQFSQSLTHFDTSQQEVKGLLSAHGEMLKDVKQTLSQNMTGIQANIESLDSRVKALK